MPAKEKPLKPRADFPLFAHASGVWAKKINGALKYFGPWDKPVEAENRYRDFIGENDGKNKTVPVAKASGSGSKLPKGFPLTLRADGRFCKQIKGKMYYFGTDRDEALKQYKEIRDTAFDGSDRPPQRSNQLTVKQLCDAFLKNFKRQVESGEKVKRTYNDYKGITKQILEHFGESRLVGSIKPMDFSDYRSKFAGGHEPKTILNFVVRNKVIFNFAHEYGLMPDPIRWGKFFAPPSDKTLAIAKEKGPRKLFEAEDIHHALKIANVDQKAMILLGINCAFGPMDISRLEFSKIDRETKWVKHIRSKTGRPRDCELWQETLDAIEAWEKVRPESEFKSNVFVTPQGKRWILPGDNSTSEFCRYFQDVWAAFGPGKTFYALRHTFRTIAGERVHDKDAIRWIMGHNAPRNEQMSDNYNQRQLPERIKAVTDAVHDWLYASNAGREAA
jgi:integrase